MRKKIFIKRIACCSILFLLFSASAFLRWNPAEAERFGGQKINLIDFYSALESQDTIKLNSFLHILENDSTSSAHAYTGALLMKKSGLKKSPKEKLPMFRQGKTLLEDAIKKENKNTEFRFLRLIIQENCPDFLKYKNNIKEDADAVKQMYKKFSPALKQAVKDYSKKSKTLKTSDFPTGG